MSRQIQEEEDDDSLVSEIDENENTIQHTNLGDPSRQASGKVNIKHHILKGIQQSAYGRGRSEEDPQLSPIKNHLLSPNMK